MYIPIDSSLLPTRLSFMVGMAVWIRDFKLFRDKHGLLFKAYLSMAGLLNRGFDLYLRLALEGGGWVMNLTGWIGISNEVVEIVHAVTIEVHVVSS